MEKINFEYIGQGGKVKMIAWGDDYLDWDISKRLEFSEALSSSLNDALDLMQKERNALLVENAILLEQVTAAEEANTNQRNNNINSITKANQTQQELIKKIRELENGNNNNVGN